MTEDLPFFTQCQTRLLAVLMSVCGHSISANCLAFMPRLVLTS